MGRLDPNSFVCYSHQDKAKAYIRTLKDNGYHEGSNSTASVVLLDHDIGRGGTQFKSQLMFHQNRNSSVFMYPHCARPMIQWDGMYPVWPYTKTVFVHGQTHKEVMRSYGYPLPIVVAGWSYSERKPFVPVIRDRYRVLFAAVHPNNNGWLGEEEMFVNQRAISILSKLPIDLTVRYTQRLSSNGIEEKIPGVRYVQGKPLLSESIKHMDEHDIVVGYQTFAYLAVARGKPTVFVAQQLRPRSGNKPGNLKFAHSWELYKHLMRFPYNLGDAKDPFALLQRAAASDEEISDWRYGVMGKHYDSDLVMRTIKEQTR